MLVFSDACKQFGVGDKILFKNNTFQFIQNVGIEILIENGVL